MSEVEFVAGEEGVAGTVAGGWRASDMVALRQPADGPRPVASGVAGAVEAVARGQTDGSNGRTGSRSKWAGYCVADGVIDAFACADAPARRCIDMACAGMATGRHCYAGAPALEDGAPPETNSAYLPHQLQIAQAQRAPERQDSTPHDSHSETPPEEQS